jgi:serine/threonine-protein kinase
MKALRKDPNARYQSAEEMRQDLLSVLQGEKLVVPAALPVAVGDGRGESATRVMTTMPPPTVPPDEVYRQMEDEPRSQLPFILTTFALLVTLAILVLVIFNLGNTGGNEDLVEIPNVEGLQFEAARLRLEADGFVVIPVFEKSDEAEAGEVIRTDPAAGTMAELGSEVDVFVSIGSELIAVPPVVGLQLDDARRAIEDAGLSVGRVTQKADAEFEVDVVIEQIPDAGVEISAAIPVDLVVSSGPEIIDLPDLTEMSERDAIAELTELGLKFTVNDEFDDDVPEGDVIRTDPVAGTEVLSGATILLVVSQGPSPVEVPDLSGMTESQAAAALDAVNLVLRVANSRQPVADPAQDGVVVGQVPAPGTTADQGDTVTVTLGEFIPPPTTTTTSTTPPTSPPGGGPP